LTPILSLIFLYIFYHFSLFLQSFLIFFRLMYQIGGDIQNIMENIKLTYLSCQIISVLFLSLFSLISSLISLSFQFFKLHFSDLANHMMSSNGSGNVSIPSHKFCLFVCFIFITILSILLSLSFNCDRRSCVDCFNLQQELHDSLPKDLKYFFWNLFRIYDHILSFFLSIILLIFFFPLKRRCNQTMGTIEDLTSNPSPKWILSSPELTLASTSLLSFIRLSFMYEIQKKSLL